MNEFNVVEIDDKTWEQLVEDSSKPVILMFYSPKCSFCEVMEPYFMNYAQEFKNSAVFARMNIVTNPGLQIGMEFRARPRSSLSVMEDLYGSRLVK